MRTIFMLTSLYLLAAVVAAKKKGKCKLKNGLKCGSLKMLNPGSVFNIESKTCRNKKYPKNEQCSWKFDVGDCTPTVHCDSIDIKGKGKNCRGDSLIMSSTDDTEVFCGKMENLTFPTEIDVEQEYAHINSFENYFFISFETNQKRQGKGFKCEVSCEATSPEPCLAAVCGCGIANRVTKIVGGVETEANEYPWQVGLAYTSSSVPFCGGSILSSTTVVTAAHCLRGVKTANLEVIVGDHDVTVDDGEERFAVCGKIEHPDYDSSTFDNDISILTLCSPLTFRREVAPVCLPTLPGPAYDDVLATVSGWGTLSSGGFQPAQLMEVNVTTMDNAKCGELYADEDITDSMICGSGEGKDSCQGDSGGPLVTLDPNTNSFYSLIGIVSWGYGCANPDFPGVYSRVTENMEFICKNMNECTWTTT